MISRRLVQGQQRFSGQAQGTSPLRLTITGSVPERKITPDYALRDSLLLTKICCSLATPKMTQPPRCATNPKKVTCTA